MIYKTTTNMNMSRVKEELEAKAKEFGFGILKSYAFQDILKEKGFPIEQEVTVYELCNPAAAQKVLSEIVEVSVYLPCRLSIYEENGKTVLATMGFEDMLGSVEIEESFKLFMSEIFEELKALMNAWNESVIQS